MDDVAGMDGSAQDYYDKLQIAPNVTNPAYPPYRSGLTVYEANTDLPAATIVVQANTQNGTGGAQQFFIPGAKDGLTPVQTTPFN